MFSPSHPKMLPNNERTKRKEKKIPPAPPPKHSNHKEYFGQQVPKFVSNVRIFPQILENYSKISLRKSQLDKAKTPKGSYLTN